MLPEFSFSQFLEATVNSLAAYVPLQKACAGGLGWAVGQLSPGASAMVLAEAMTKTGQKANRTSALGPVLKAEDLSALLADA